MNEGREKGEKAGDWKYMKPSNQAWCQSKPPFHCSVPGAMKSSLQYCGKASKCSSLKVVEWVCFSLPIFPVFPYPQNIATETSDCPLQPFWRQPTENWYKMGVLISPSFSHFSPISKSCLFLLLNIIPSLATPQPSSLPIWIWTDKPSSLQASPQTSPSLCLR